MGVSESQPISVSMLRRERLSTLTTSWPWIHAAAHQNCKVDGKERSPWDMVHAARRAPCGKEIKTHLISQVKSCRPAAEAITSKHDDFLHVHWRHSRGSRACGAQLASHGKRLAAGKLPCSTPTFQSMPHHNHSIPSRSFGAARLLEDCIRLCTHHICAPVFEVLSLIMFSKDGIPKKPETEARVREGTAPDVKAATPPAMPSEHTITLRHILFSFDCAHVDSAKEAGVSPPKNGLISLQTPRTLITDYLYFNRI